MMSLSRPVEQTGASAMDLFPPVHFIEAQHRNTDARRASRISPSNPSPDSIAGRMLGGYRGRTRRHHHDGPIWR
jgi:hypothetical protein